MTKSKILNAGREDGAYQFRAYEEDGALPVTMRVPKDLLVGRRIVDTRIHRDHHGHIYRGELVLDDGRVLQIDPMGEECCAWYWIESLATTPNAVTSAKVVVSEDPEEFSKVYTLFVYMAGLPKIAAAVIAGSDGTGYYGTGFELTVVEK